MARFEVVQSDASLGSAPVFHVVDRNDRSRPVARFADRAAADAHAARLEAGPFDWDEQEAWKDDWPDDRGEGPAGRSG